jgi:hypothetical protein
MASIRNRTFRKSAHDLSSNVIDFAVNDSLQKLIAAEAGTAYKRPWHRLERGLRLNRLRAFTDDLGNKRGLKDSEKQALLTLLSKALDKKLLNSKTSVEYDQEEEVIKEIKPLVMHQSATGEVLFQLLEKRNAVTFRKKSQDKTVDQPTVIIEPETSESQPQEA